MPYGTLAADLFQNSAGLTASSIPPAFRNRLINGAMQVWQRSTSTTVTAGTAVPTASTGYYTADRWFIYAVGANATAARTTGTGNNQYNLQITGAASMTNIGVGQRIETANSYDLAGDTVTLSVQMANSLLTTVNWTINYANSTDAFGTIASPTKTIISNGSWTVTSTMTTYTATVTIPAAATTGLEVLFTVGSQVSGTWTIGSAQLEIGSYNTSFDYRPIGTELALCQRYFQIQAQLTAAVATATVVNAWGQLNPPMRATPTPGQTGVLNFQGDGTNNATQSGTGLGNNYCTAYSIYLGGVPNFTGLTTARTGALGTPVNNANYLTFAAEVA